MSTIPQRLREIAVRIGTHDMAAYVQLRAIANELDAPAADAVPVVAHLSTDKTKFMYDSTIQARGGLSVWHEYTRPLVYQRDHLAAVSALQARINELEARQVVPNAVLEAVKRMSTPIDASWGIPAAAAERLTKASGVVEDRPINQHATSINEL